MSRREFSKAVRLEIIKRAMPSDHGAPGYARCESCQAPIVKFEIDHRDPDAMQTDKSRKLTAEDGWLLCLPCHSEKTKRDVADIAKAKRREAAHVGARRPKQTIPSAKGALRGPERKHEGRPPLPPRSLYR